jgi:hypothetical protein
MIEEAPRNKMEIAPKRKDEPEKVTIRAVSVIKNEYHFPGSGIFKPLSVVATTIEEATKIWRDRREPVQVSERKSAAADEAKDAEKPGEDTTYPETKVEEPKTNNE